MQVQCLHADCVVCFYNIVIVFSNFLVNSADRVIRVFDIDAIMASVEEDEPEALQRLQDLVNRCVCVCVCVCVPN